MHGMMILQYIYICMVSENFLGALEQKRPGDKCYLVRAGD